MPTVELNGVMAGEAGAEAVLQDDQGTLGNLELDGSTNGSIFVFTDPANLATLQVRIGYLLVYYSTSSDASILSSVIHFPTIEVSIYSCTFIPYQSPISPVCQVFQHSIFPFFFKSFMQWFYCN